MGAQFPREHPESRPCGLLGPRLLIPGVDALSSALLFGGCGVRVVQCPGRQDDESVWSRRTSLRGNYWSTSRNRQDRCGFKPRLVERTPRPREIIGSGDDDAGNKVGSRGDDMIVPVTLERFGQVAPTAHSRDPGSVEDRECHLGVE
jgi:hypothetical protein